MLYHVTTEENLNQIMRDGLIPMIGSNSAKVNEKEKYIFLCRKDEVPYWQILLSCSVVLQVDVISEIDNNIAYYGLYNEFIHKTPISSDKIKKISFPQPTAEHMKKLCISYISSFSYFTELCARYYDNNPSFDDLVHLNIVADSIIAVVDKLDYSVLSKSEIKKVLASAGDDGEYTLCDHYYDTDKRLYEQLICYPDDELSEKRKVIHKHIVNNLSGCLSVETGGWCG